MAKRILCVDFDGVLHSYTSPWIDEATIPDPPVPGALRWLWAASEFFDVQIYSSRSRNVVGRDAMKQWLLKWLDREFGERHPMSGDGAGYPVSFVAEKPAAFLTIDDRAICFDGDWLKLEPSELINFQPWNRRSKA